MGSWSTLKVWVTGLLITILSAVAFIGYCNWLVDSETTGRLYSDTDQLPYSRVGLLLGTSRYSREGGINDHYILRIESAKKLFQAGKIDYILISGDNSTPYYDEPTTIRRDLLKMGIPENRIYRDYAGFRTLDSIVRADSVFGEHRFIVISQAYHNKRAVYIAVNKGIDAIAFNAGDGSQSDWQNKTREILARVLAVIEVHLLSTDPKFLGPKIMIGETPPT
ncbi:SanA protein [Endozoicomonas sp. OPT23]|uniref:SanA/YdcF family protein n=1 Tax=Endozoicomonas sp. OPT23 TaxID=2072845 RepID=UPI00129A7BD8|nr:ElyC/SanA/YdcF family protein [Endozoicomonas sp. OPT23]MRI32191.1 SanA protein [Endozoicomonas sp. OPT23]